MRQVPIYILNHEKVVEAYGRWPSFHDSPVLSFTDTSDTITLVVQTWEMTSEVDEKGFYKLEKKNEIGFSFTGIVSRILDDFIRENILFELGFSSIEEQESFGYFKVALVSAMGSDLCGTFSASFGKVTFIEPYND